MPKYREKKALTIEYMASALVQREVARGWNKPEAQERVADRAKVSAGSLYTFMRGRMKDVKSRFVEAITAEFIRDTEREIARLRHDLEIARLVARHPNEDQVLEAQKHILALESILAEWRG